jgi:hypothetical protein
MSCSLLTTNRSYLKFSLYILYRHLSTIEHYNYDQSILRTSQRNLSTNSIKEKELKFFRNNYYQKRYITLHVPPAEEKKSLPKINERMPFQFPPGNPNDKPKLEHLRFIENQLIHIVNVYLIVFIFIEYFLLVTRFL